MNENEVRTILLDLPTSVHGFVFHEDDGQTVVALNARLPQEIQRKAYDHELNHISSGEMDDPTYEEY